MENGLPINVVKAGRAAEKAQEKFIQGTLIDDKPKPKDDEIVIPEGAEGIKVEPDDITPPPDEKKDKLAEPVKKGSLEEEVEKSRKLYSALKGKYDTEIPALEARLETANKTAEHLNELLTIANSKIEALESAGEKPDITDDAITEGINPEDFEGYGEEMMKLVNLINEQAKIIKRQGSDLSEIKGEVTTVKGKVDTVEKEKADESERQLLRDLADPKIGNVPDYEQIDKREDWKEFLESVDPLSGVSRQLYLNDAFAKKDAVRVANIFKAFKEQAGITGTLLKTPKPLDENLGGGDGEGGGLGDILDLDTASGEELPKKKRIVTREEFTAAVTKHRQGKMSDEDFNKLSNRFQYCIKKGWIK